MKVTLFTPKHKGRPRCGCAYEEWNGKIKAIARCDLPPAVKFGNRNLCTEHAVCVIAAVPNADYFDAKGSSIPTGTEFIRMLRKEHA